VSLRNSCLGLIEGSADEQIELALATLGETPADIQRGELGIESDEDRARVDRIAELDRIAIVPHLAGMRDSTDVEMGRRFYP
jgi:hypothetical protein